MKHEKMAKLQGRTVEEYIDNILLQLVEARQEASEARALARDLRASLEQTLEDMRKHEA